MSLKPYLTLKVCIFADNKVGKKLLTSKFLEYLSDEKSDTSLTLGVEFNIKDVVIDGKLIRLSVWEFCSKDRFKNLWSYYLLGTHGVLLMYDITNAETLDKLTEWSELIKKNTKEGIPLLLVGNKLDLEENRQVPKELVKRFKEENNITESMEISLQTGENVEKMFKKLTEMIEGEKILL